MDSSICQKDCWGNLGPFGCFIMGCTCWRRDLRFRSMPASGFIRLFSITTISVGSGRILVGVSRGRMIILRISLIPLFIYTGSCPISVSCWSFQTPSDQHPKFHPFRPFILVRFYWCLWRGLSCCNLEESKIEVLSLIYHWL